MTYELTIRMPDGTNRYATLTSPHLGLSDETIVQLARQEGLLNEGETLVTSYALSEGEEK